MNGVTRLEFTKSRKETTNVMVRRLLNQTEFFISVLNAKNIIPLDPNGLSDPFVLIELCPHALFPRQTVQQTKIIKNTLNPVFDESFEL